MKWFLRAFWVEENVACFGNLVGVPPSSAEDAHNEHMALQGVTERRPNRSERVSLLLLPLPSKLSVLVGGMIVIFVPTAGRRKRYYLFG